MAKINVLPRHLYELIAAGEVVERPASIVKELTENSIDAGAKSITIEIQNGGIRYIRITDDGCGIAREDIKTAFLSHATSKISSESDLDAILTLGFRGEALPSVAGVSRTEVLTKTPDEFIGTRYCIEFGDEKFIDEAGCPNGTTITVRDLFSNTPARMKFLKKDTSEANAVSSIVEKLAVSHPGISFSLIRDGKQALFTTGSGDLKNTVREVFGKEFSRQLIFFEDEYEGVKIHGGITKPEFSRPNRNGQYFFLNSRSIKNITLSTALLEAYKHSIMVGKFPACVLFVDVDPNFVDINVHPSKAEVRFADEKKFFYAVYYSAVNALSKKDEFKAAEMKKPSAADTFAFNNDEEFTLLTSKPSQLYMVSEGTGEPGSDKEEKKESFVPENTVTTREPALKPEPSANENKPQSTFVTAAAPESSNGSAKSEDEFLDALLLGNSSVPEGKKTAAETVTVANEESKITFTDETESRVVNDNFRYIGEAFKTYIICEYEGSVVFIDKHAAHERMLYEKLKKDYSKRNNQILLFPVTITPSKEEYSVLIDNSEMINNAGFEIRDFGSGSVIVSECPMELDIDDIEDVILEIADGFLKNKQNVSFDKIDSIFHSVACRSAIKAGNSQTPEELSQFAQTVLKRNDIRHCPHGRPVVIEMKKRELDKNFGRIQ